ncbi:MAG: U32 family peptidase [Paracoccaceae bacterium]|nr:U32 family peptidase [Paracoccaceae bacterium]
MKPNLTIGPILFHWPAEKKLEFYARIAEEAPVDTVYLGEVVCSKRSPFFEQYYEDVAERLTKAGKTVVFSSLAEIMLKRERNMMAGFCEIDSHEIEINDASALWHLDGHKFRVGPLMNAYNEETLRYLAGQGATHFAMPTELPGSSVAIMARAAQDVGASCEVQVFGRAQLALSARCYHARAHGRIKDNCQFVCELDPDGMPLRTLDGNDFLAINGIQTLSHKYINLMAELPQLREIGITHFRLVPQDVDMVAVAEIWRAALDGVIDPEEGQQRLDALNLPAAFANGFWHGQAGVRKVAVERALAGL